MTIGKLLKIMEDIAAKEETIVRLHRKRQRDTSEELEETNMHIDQLEMQILTIKETELGDLIED